MDKNSSAFEQFLITQSVQVPLLGFLTNLILAGVLAWLLSLVYIRYGNSISNRKIFANNIVLLAVTTMVIITIVKSSLALSLGLVGALSIVRFRTAIKEPEELAYLFIAIAMGLGLGANQTIPTLVAGPVILAVMALFNLKQREFKKKNLFLSLDWVNHDDVNEQLLNQFNAVIEKHVLVSDLRRMDVRDNSIEATYFIDIKSPENLSALVGDLKSSFSGNGVTFIDQNQMPSF